jgi:hypothetical protein
MNDDCDPQEVERAADALVTAYGTPQNALEKARRAEDTSHNRAFARLVREELERRCSDRGIRLQ